MTRNGPNRLDMQCRDEVKLLWGLWMPAGLYKSKYLKKCSENRGFLYEPLKNEFINQLATIHTGFAMDCRKIRIQIRIYYVQGAESITSPHNTTSDKVHAMRNRFVRNPEFFEKFFFSVDRQL